ncbi:hypothetical protein MMC06_006214 [Schaereria dolodes]|nr:hypothetical protein [Schaereria dolodes]
MISNSISYLSYESESDLDLEDTAPIRLDTPPRLSQYSAGTTSTVSNKKSSRRSARCCKNPSVERRKAIRDSRLQSRYRWKKVEIFDIPSEKRPHRSLYKQKQPDFRGFEKLPAELILHVMKHADIDDLPNLVLSGHAAHSVWESSRNAIFNGIVEVQFPEFEPLFGPIEGLKGKIGTRTNAIKITDIDEDVQMEEVQDNRTRRQKQNLIEAITDDVRSSRVAYSGPLQPLMCLSDRQAIMTGGRPYLKFLQRMSIKLDRQMEALDSILSGVKRPALPRGALLLLWQLQWYYPSDQSVLDGMFWSFEEPTMDDRVSTVWDSPKQIHIDLLYILGRIRQAVTHPLSLREISDFYEAYENPNLQGPMSKENRARWIERQEMGLIVIFTLRHGIEKMASIAKRVVTLKKDLLVGEIRHVWRDKMMDSLQDEDGEDLLADDTEADSDDGDVAEEGLIEAGLDFCDRIGAFEVVWN